MEAYNKGKRRRANPEYTKLTRSGHRPKGRYVPPRMGADENFKRLRYVRYADDFLIGVSGSLKDCKELKKEIAEFLNQELMLELNEEKTRITHARTESARFLGHKIYVTDPSKYPERYIKKEGKARLTRITPRPRMDAPIAELVKKLSEQGYCKRNGNPTGNGRWIHEKLEDIVRRHKLLERGLLNYYQMATNYGRTAARVHYILKYSCALSIARKMRLRTLKKVYRKYGGQLKIRDEKGIMIANYPTPKYAKPEKIVTTMVIHPIEFITETSKY